MSSNTPRVSIIIAFYKNEKYLRECLEHCLRLDYPNYEIIVVSARQIKLDSRVKHVIVSSEAQGIKKNEGVATSSGDLCAFIDDDAYPDKEWLKNAVKYFTDPHIGAVCGPGVTPPGDGIKQKASGAIYSSFIGSGPLRYRYIPTKVQYVDMAPGYNVIIRCSLLKKIGGFRSNLRSGEDDLISAEILKMGKKILYAPDVIVYHHRRPLFIPHLRQVMNYGLHRGFFMKKYSQTSTKLVYFLPFIAIVSVGSILPLVIYYTIIGASLVFQIFGFVVGAYLATSFISAYKISKDMRVALLAMIGTPLTHLAYALGFIKGLLTRSIGERPSY
jgi:cellulose synthase/poly-beta-1,6-N-acetylglucosamine synthase-like glycosyltransferase